MKVNELFPSKYLGRDDIKGPTTATIQQVVQQEMMDNGARKMKPMLMFQEANLKPMILNRINASAISAIYGDDTTGWIGKRIELYVDPTVMMQGRAVGGLRIRSVQNNPFAGSPAPATSYNGTGHVGHWDLSDGTVAYQNISADDVRKTILDSGRPASAWKAKPAGAPRELAKPVPELGIATALPPVEDNIPF